MAPHGQGAEINFYIRCAVGAIVGGLAGVFIGNATKATRIEEVLVGIFGAFIGGEFVTAMLLNSGKEQTNFTTGGLLNAIGGAAAMILLLTVMRRAVGPMQSRKKPPHRIR